MLKKHYVAVRMTEDYRFDDLFLGIPRRGYFQTFRRLPLVSDLEWPQSIEFLVKGPEDLKKLRYVLYDPSKEDLSSFNRKVEEVKKFADSRVQLKVVQTHLLQVWHSKCAVQ